MRSQQSAIMSLVVGAIELDGVTSNAPPTDADFKVLAIDFSGATKAFVHNMPFEQLMKSTAYIDPRCEGAKERLASGPLPQAELSFLEANC
jgi:hypothetical protein